ncbi:hypothetical protein PMAYCL1PPCAC_08178, partial [Pristionchus mayeri]
GGWGGASADLGSDMDTDMGDPSNDIVPVHSAAVDTMVLIYSRECMMQIGDSKPVLEQSNFEEFDGLVFIDVNHTLVYAPPNSSFLVYPDGAYSREELLAIEDNISVVRMTSNTCNQAN